MRSKDDWDQDPATQPLSSPVSMTRKPGLATQLPTVSAHHAAQRVALALETRPQAELAPLLHMTEPETGSIAEDDATGTSDLKLPSAWYTTRQPARQHREAMSPERHSLLLRIGAAVCFTLAFGSFLWLSQNRQAPQGTPSIDPLLTHAASFAAAATDPAGPAIRSEKIPTAQLLAVAERFVATGDVLAARAMLQDRASDSDARAQFALAETYDPHLLASWGTRDAEPSVTYARFLYEAARRGGIAEAQLRLDALK